VRLGDGTEVSAQKMQQAVDNLWRFTAELFEADDVELALIEEGIAVDPRELRQAGKAKCLPACTKPPACARRSGVSHRRQERAAHRTSGADAGRDAISPARLPGQQW
jgi:1,2-phenylacetyl-CoA epoxidase catalytic subunit